MACLVWWEACQKGLGSVYNTYIQWFHIPTCECGGPQPFHPTLAYVDHIKWIAAPTNSMILHNAPLWMICDTHVCTIHMYVQYTCTYNTHVCTIHMYVQYTCIVGTYHSMSFRLQHIQCCKHMWRTRVCWCTKHWKHGKETQSHIHPYLQAEELRKKDMH